MKALPIEFSKPCATCNGGLDWSFEGSYSYSCTACGTQWSSFSFMEEDLEDDYASVETSDDEGDEDG